MFYTRTFDLYKNYIKTHSLLSSQPSVVIIYQTNCSNMQNIIMPLTLLINSRMVIHQISISINLYKYCLQFQKSLGMLYFISIIITCLTMHCFIMGNLVFVLDILITL